MNRHLSSLPLHSHYTASEQIILSVAVFQAVFPHDAFFWQRQWSVHPSARKMNQQLGKNVSAAGRAAEKVGSWHAVWKTVLTAYASHI